MIHLYFGDGKGKTSAAMGLCLRMAGRGRRVVIAQFLKSEGSGERAALRCLPEVELLPLPERVKFSFQLSAAEREAERARCAGMLDTLEYTLRETVPGLLLLDEICAAVNSGLVPLPRVLSLLKLAPPSCELVLTGRDPPEALLDCADYLTRFEKIRHPFDRGVPAREGVEY